MVLGSLADVHTQPAAKPKDRDGEDLLKRLARSPTTHNRPSPRIITSDITPLLSNVSHVNAGSHDLINTSNNADNILEHSLPIDRTMRCHIKSIEANQIVKRGRTLERESKSAWSLKRADSRHPRNIGMAKVNNARIHTRFDRRCSTSAEDHSNSYPDLGDQVLEPFLYHHVCGKMSETEEIPSESLQGGIQTYSQLPPEIMYQIYFNLSPADFNAARHTCRSWYINSIERSLLDTMLNRGGWSTGHKYISAPNRTHDLAVRSNHEWLVSKFVARECALGPDWTGNGLSPSKETQISEFLKSTSKKTPFVCTSTTGFTESGVYYPSTDGTTLGMIFTVSSCGKFLIMAHGCVAYIYELNRGRNGDEDEDERVCGSLRPVTSVICPRRILACSMDTSSRRYTIAILLDGRMGLVSDLTGIRDRRRHSSSTKAQRAQEIVRYRECDYRNRVSISSSRSRGLYRTQAEQPFVFPIIAAEASQTNFGSETPSFLPPSSPIPIEPSIPTLYAPLCSADDPPRSVAICPQRRCVAFGCSSGIELHWVDALTGQDLSRWFPLTAPSDYLYFLPPRVGVDSAKKLRLISSAGQPGERPAIADRFGTAKTGLIMNQRTRSNPFWGISSGQYTMSRDNSDHYHAVPLSDGYHILFTDPGTGILCLGSDAPIGGPNKLLRKIWFVRPQNEGTPVAYTAGSDLKNGVRVVAAYGQGTEQSVWLFSVPCDLFSESQEERGGINTTVSETGSEAPAGGREWVKWCCNRVIYELPAPLAAVQGVSVREDKLWPVQVRGQEIGKMCGLVDLTVDATTMTIWAFGRDGIAKTWQLDDGSLDGIGQNFTVMRDGAIREGFPCSDVEMTDVSFEAADHETFDGSASMTASSVLVLGGQQYLDYQASANRLGGDYDDDGDILMADLPNYEIDVADYDSDGSFETIALAHGAHEDVYHHEYLSGRSYVEQLALQGQDWVHLLTGVARIDVEIR